MSERKRVIGWYFFDWASQPYWTLGLTFIFGPFFASVLSERLVTQGMAAEAAAAQTQAIWSWTLAIAGFLIAVSAPLLGAFADAAGRRLPWVWFFSALYVVGAWGLWFTYPDGSTWVFALMTFGLGFIAAEFATIFTNAILPDLGETGETGETGAISGSGFALGYVGGVLALAVMLLFFVEQATGRTLIGLLPPFGLDPALAEGTRFVGPFVAIWYVIFMVPFFLWVKEPKPGEVQRTTVGVALGALMTTLRGLPRRISLSSYLGSSLFYRDALNGLYGFGGVYATLVLDWQITQIGIFGILGAVTAAIFSFVGGRIDRARGPKPVITGSIVILIGVTLVIVGMSRESIYGVPLAEGSNLPDVIMFVLGGIIGAAGGTLQASSRTMMVLHADPARPTEAFGLYALSGKATAFLAPTLIGIVTTVSGSPRLGVSPLIVLFFFGLILLFWVKPDGEKSAG